VNFRALVILVLALFFVAQDANTIEAGVTEEHGGIQSSYVLSTNAQSSSLLSLLYSDALVCSPPSGCTVGYDCYIGGKDVYITSCNNIFVSTTIQVLCTSPPPDGISCLFPTSLYTCPILEDGIVHCTDGTINNPYYMPPPPPPPPPPSHNNTSNVDKTLPVVTIEPSENNDLNSSKVEMTQPMVTVPRLGSGTFKSPGQSNLISTSEWGKVPANQILVVPKKDCCSQCTIEALANSLHGKVVGYIDFINLYQIEIPGKDETDLRKAISKAKANPCIDLAFPHQVVSHENSPLDDPVYSNGRNICYQIVGVQKAWDAIRNSGFALDPAKVAVVDDGLYKGYGEFDGVVRVDTKSNGSLLKEPSTDYPVAGSHGTGIMNIIAADPDNGGLVGIASEPLRKNLTVTMINMQSSMYSKSGDAWYMGYMLALSKAGVGSDLISFSWGNSEADPDAVKESGDFFREWATTYPDHLFICSAGNDGRAMDGSRRFPYVYNMPNVITVGCINNDGTLQEDSNRVSSNFEVTLGVPGDQVVWGKDNAGDIADSGGETSMAVPFVTAAAAMIRSLDPSLNASSIKSLLVETGRQSIYINGKQVPAPKEVGGRVLAIDLAVEKVIADLNNKTEVA
jgi:hypothetical protein